MDYKPVFRIPTKEYIYTADILLPSSIKIHTPAHIHWAALVTQVERVELGKGGLLWKANS